MGRILAIVVALIVVAGAALFLVARQPGIPAEDFAAHSEFDAELIRQGTALAAVGNCIACHTVPGQKAFAGGLPLPTPFGTIYSTNITPDAETGIGLWSEAAFVRAMREGVDRAGNHLYPAFPYDHFTRVTDEDLDALYAFLMTREPVDAATPENDLRFPYNIRPLLAGWKALYFEDGVFQPDPSQSDEWNRGAYLAEGLGHCGGCHTPRNRFGAEDLDRHFEGGEAEGWQAYAIDENSPAPIPWDRDSMTKFLREGWHELHGVSRGPMAEVTGNLAGLPEEDVAAISTYVVSLMGEPSAERQAAAEALIERTQGGAGAQAPEADSQTPPAATDDAGAAIYASSCGTCHDAGRPPPFGGLDFALSTAVNAPNPQNIINVTLFGLPAADGEASAMMPDFAAVLDDEEMVALLNYMRAEFTEREAWTGLEGLVSATRSGAHAVSIRPTDGIERAPANVGAGS